MRFVSFSYCWKAFITRPGSLQILNIHTLLLIKLLLWLLGSDPQWLTIKFIVWASLEKPCFLTADCRLPVLSGWVWRTELSSTLQIQKLGVWLGQSQVTLYNCSHLRNKRQKTNKQANKHLQANYCTGLITEPTVVETVYSVSYFWSDKLRGGEEDTSLALEQLRPTTEETKSDVREGYGS